MPNTNEHTIFINIAKEIAKFSKCQSKQVGCIIVKDGRIISSGCNGTPSGAINCCDVFDKNKLDPNDQNYDSDYRAQHHAFSESLECHAEENAILMAAKFGNSIDGAVFYTSLKPCERCLKMIANLNVKRIYYHDVYDFVEHYSESVEQMIRSLNIQLIQI